MEKEEYVECLSARVELTSEGLVLAYSLIGHSIDPRISNDLFSVNLGGESFPDPVNTNNIPELVSNKLRIMLMRKRSMEAIGIWLERSYSVDDVRALATVVWVYELFANLQTLEEILRRESWVYEPESGKRHCKIILDRLKPSSMSDSSYKTLCTDLTL